MTSENSIAVVGASCRLPGARDLDAYWELLVSGRTGFQSIRREAAERSRLKGIDPRAPDWVGVCAALDEVDCFDAKRFGYSPREAQVMDPQQRVMLECARAALDDAAITPASVEHAVGVFIASTASGYLLENLADSRARDEVGVDTIAIHNNADFLPTSISYKLDLRGPSCAVQTACSGSLVAVHLACRALLDGECDVALAGGVSVRLPQLAGYHAATGGVMSPSGECRPYASDADGTLFGSGAGLVVLQRLEDALAKGSRILGVIAGSAVNNDGHAKVGFTAPSQLGQRAVIADALAAAGWEPSDVQYVEGHGTATRLGDEIELRALRDVFGQDTRAAPLWLGSCKGNVGHAESAAGIAGFLKVLLMLRHRQIPLTRGSEDSPLSLASAKVLRVARRCIPWERGSAPLRAGVSSFGIGGTNAHVVLEEPPERPEAPPDLRARPRLVSLSATTAEAATALAERLADRLEADSGLSLGDVAYTLHVGREPLPFRVDVVGSTASAVAAKLRVTAPVASSVEGAPRVALLFPGQGGEVAAMTRQLRRDLPLFRRTFDALANPLARRGGPDLVAACADEREHDTDVLQPLLFLTSHALTEVLHSLGLTTDVVLGHSLGEWNAAVASGAIEAASALEAVAARGRLMAGTRQGGMVAVSLGEEAVAERLTPGLSLAAVNGRAATVVSGPESALAGFCEGLDRLGIPWQRLRTRRAFHSALMDPVLGGLRDVLGSVRAGAPGVPLISSSLGTRVDDVALGRAEYWVQQARGPVRFMEALGTLKSVASQGGGTLVALEVGPGRALASAAKQYDREAFVPVSCCAMPERDALGQLLEALGRLRSLGCALRLEQLYDGEPRRRLALPAYPFARTRFWLEPSTSASVEEAPARRSAPTKGDDEASRTLSTRAYSWQRVVPAAPREATVPSEEPSPWLVLMRDGAPGRGFVAGLRQRGLRVVEVAAGLGYERLDDQRFVVRAGVDEDLRRVVEALSSRGGPPSGAVHLWGVGPSGVEEEARCFWGLASLLRVLGQRPHAQGTRVFSLTEQAHDVLGTEALVPERAMLGPLSLIASQEMTGLWCTHFDCDSLDATRAAVLDELLAPSPRPLLAFRGRHVWARSHPAVELPSADRPSLLREKGVYLITGGTGRFGSIVAKLLLESWGATVYALSRGKSHAVPVDPRVQVVEADVTDAAALGRVVQDIVRRHGRLHGVFHAAGTIRDETHCALMELTAERCEEQLAPRVDGVRALERALEGVEVDFRLTTSSMSPILGGLGLAAYGAANGYVDAFVQAAPQEKGWRAIHWEGWHRGTATARTSYSDGIAANQRNRMLSDDELTHVLDRALRARELRRLVVTRDDLEERVRQWVRSPESPAAPGEVTAVPGGEAGLPGGADLTATLTGIVQALLGVEPRPTDDLFELGANSLTAVQLLARLRSTFQVDLPLRVLFEGPTIAQLSLALAMATGAPVDDPEIARLLDEVESLSEDEAHAQLQQPETPRGVT
ncbi:SDR family oxidoreductase [Myxococcus sp. K38C18041901]|uniref:type I polyketide synthase n=1 Tax=Myxococcus guangdongensis TaxID=2906760 RepID=UPI0020A81EC3|nr:type I polyketide synthase [Myxococcus guangdongensis]MCP3059806.1 SDR family oxidoreductase [Myxococcus guangdongensis]